MEKILKILTIAFGGKGLAKTEENGKTIPVFVKYGVPGDEVKVKTVRKEKKYVEAEISEIIKPSKYRIKPVCEHFRYCGGCQFLNMKYEEQLKHKTQMLKAVLERNNKCLEVNEIIGSDKNLNYRLRAKYRIKGNSMGFYKEESHEIVPIKECHIVEMIINEIADKIKKKLGDCELEIIKNASKEEVYVKIKGNSDRVKRFCDKNPQITGYFIEGVAHKKAVFEIDGLKYEPECFTQVNPEQNKKIVEIVVKEAEGKVLDLYCGIGNYTVPLSKKCSSVVGVEGNRKSCEYALLNSKGRKNIKITNMEVERFLSEKQEEYDTTVFNPSRRSRPIDFTKLRTKKIIYVSCNPEQLSKDIKILQNLGFKISKIQPVDMFPQTYHIETVAVLEK
jgi:23S rRNA (uracil1939-C5)-methyltransferase